MRITHEADYAIRVAYCLAEHGGKLGAKDISEATGVTLRFALKILRKLILGGMVRSYKGAAGGYELVKPPSEISMGEIIECIDGPIQINHCLCNEFECTRVSSKGICNFRKVFGSVNRMIRTELYNVTLDQFLNS
ncbi:MAG: Rrf2 family transcriptional regulator [Clostridiales bacterium]|nr:Rrf2 family transcriptional regulator [Butyricicoccus pullicaecorum]MCI6720593.1 Rrf2 family transcriptional regulator [Clostridiales bacterium]